MIMQSLEGGVKGTESPLPYLPFGNIKRKQSSDDINTVEPRNNKGPKDWQTAFALTCTITRFLYIEVLFYIYIFLFLGRRTSYSTSLHRGSMFHTVVTVFRGRTDLAKTIEELKMTE